MRSCIPDQVASDLDSAIHIKNGGLTRWSRANPPVLGREDEMVVVYHRLGGLSREK